MLYIDTYQPIQSYNFTQRAPKGVNETTLVLLNESCTPHLFFVHVHAITVEL